MDLLQQQLLDEKGSLNISHSHVNTITSGVQTELDSDLFQFCDTVGLDSYCPLLVGRIHYSEEMILRTNMTPETSFSETGSWQLLQHD